MTRQRTTKTERVPAPRVRGLHPELAKAFEAAGPKAQSEAIAAIWMYCYRPKRIKGGQVDWEQEGPDRFMVTDAQRRIRDAEFADIRKWLDGIRAQAQLLTPAQRARVARKFVKHTAHLLPTPRKGGAR